VVTSLICHSEIHLAITGAFVRVEHKMHNICSSLECARLRRCVGGEYGPGNPAVAVGRTDSNHHFARSVLALMDPRKDSENGNHQCRRS
jgi:hypothetical protein